MTRSTASRSGCTSKEFFGASQLSQFMDLIINPLAEITQCCTALGPGGFPFFNVLALKQSDVHVTQFS
jgi:DNA-directed RNA polymerase beta subunit